MMDKSIPITAGIVILLALTGTIYYITNIDQTYYCQDRNIVTMCFKLSSPTNNISSRCYYNETLPTKYFSCTSGWKNIKNFPEIMKNLTITGNEIIEKSYDTNITADMSPFIKQNFNPQYGVITLSSSKTGKIAEYSLTSKTESIIDIGMEGKSCLYQDGTLFDDKIFKDKFGNLTTLKASQFFINDSKEYSYDNNTYNTTCIENKASNGTEYQTCDNKLVSQGKIIVHEETFIPYNKEILKQGCYKWQFKGQRTIGQILDVQPVKSDIPLDEWVWYNESWSRKVPIFIGVTWMNLNQTSTLINVTYDSDMNASFGDLRFVETTELGYWFYNNTYVTGTSVLIWVFTGDLNSTSNKTIYMYYGNSAVFTTSNISNAFIYGDDWNSGPDFAVYTSTNNGLYTTSGGQLIMAAATSYDSPEALGYNISQQNVDFIMRGATDTVTSNNRITAYMINTTRTGRSQRNLIRISKFYADNGWDSTNYNAGTAVANIYYLYRNILNFTSLTSRVYNDDTNLAGPYSSLIASATSTSTNVFGTTSWFPAMAQLGVGTGKVDWWFIKRTVPSEPTVVFGAEQGFPVIIGHLLDQSGLVINGGTIYIYNSTGDRMGTTTSNASGDWTYQVTTGTITNYTFDAKNNANTTQGGVSSPFVSG